MVAKDNASLLCMATLGSIEMNPWHSKSSNRNFPAFAKKCDAMAHCCCLLNFNYCGKNLQIDINEYKGGTPMSSNLVLKRIWGNPYCLNGITVGRRCGVHIYTSAIIIKWPKYKLTYYNAYNCWKNGHQQPVSLGKA